LSTLSEPELEPVPPAPDVALQIEALHRSMPVAPAEPAALPEPAPLAPAAVAVEITEPASPVGATAAPEPTQEAALQSNEAPASSDSAETMRAAPDAVRDADTARPDEARAPGQVSEPPAASASEPVATADAKADATPALPEPAALPEPVLEVAAAAAAPNPTASIPTESRPALTEHRAAAIETAVAPTPPVPARVRERVPFAGAWAASAEACTPAMQEEGHLVARIGARGGRAGDTGCGFKSIRRRGSTWQIAAACSDGETSWRSDVRLSLSGGRLTWASQRGTTVYVRCPRA
jgi:hypothetical protein